LPVEQIHFDKNTAAMKIRQVVFQ